MGFQRYLYHQDIKVHFILGFKFAQIDLMQEDETFANQTKCKDGHQQTNRHIRRPRQPLLN